MDGQALAGRIKSRADLPILVLSAIVEADSKADLIAHYAEDYVTKPYDYAELLARIRRILRRLRDQIRSTKWHSAISRSLPAGERRRCGGVAWPCRPPNHGSWRLLPPVCRQPSPPSSCCTRSGRIRTRQTRPMSGSRSGASPEAGTRPRSSDSPAHRARWRLPPGSGRVASGLRRVGETLSGRNRPFVRAAQDVRRHSVSVGTLAARTLQKDDSSVPQPRSAMVGARNQP